MQIRCTNPECLASKPEYNGVYVERWYTGCSCCQKKFTELGIDLGGLYKELDQAHIFRDRLLSWALVFAWTIFLLSGLLIWALLPRDSVEAAIIVVGFCIAMPYFYLRDTVSSRMAKKKFPKIASFLDWRQSLCG